MKAIKPSVSVWHNLLNRLTLFSPAEYCLFLFLIHKYGYRPDLTDICPELSETNH